MWNIINIIVLTFLFSCSTPNIKQKWGSFKSPTIGESKSIGSYSAGCLQGAKTLSLNPIGLIQMRPSRQKYYGHINLLSFLQQLGEKFYNSQRKYLLVGDLSQPRGGPTENGHASHQTGLDVDIWFDFVNKRSDLTYMDLEHKSALNYVVNNKLYNWSQDHEKLILLTVQDERVNRVFVSPPIKKYFCESGLEDKFLKKIRPWWGHKDHVHVRLNCPEKDAQCNPHEPIEDNGCIENLAWWYSDEPAKALTEMSGAKKEISLPIECDEIEKQKKFSGENS